MRYEDTRTTAKITTTTSVPRAIAAARILAALHNHSLMIELNPLVKSHHSLNTTSSQEAQGPSTSKCTHSITDSLSYLPFHLWDSEINYTAAFLDIEDGLVTEVSAPLDVKIVGEWKLMSPNERSSTCYSESSAGNGCGEEDWILQETATVSCSIFLMPFVKGQIKQSHEDVHQRFRKRLEGTPR